MKNQIDIKNDQTNCRIDIRLNDECKNGHQDFGITATFWEPNKERTDRNMMHRGCYHEEILAIRPDLHIFVNLHLCDYLGIPMYPVSNGKYHLERMDRDEYCKYYRISIEQWELLRRSSSKGHFEILLFESDILKQWRDEANRGIELMEELTGERFVNTSTRTQWDGELTNINPR